MNKLTFAFDIGHASIGWSVISAADNEQSLPEVRGTGVVLFPADDCLASVRRNHRRTRRTIRARRKRIDRIGSILEHHGVITSEERFATGHPVPFYIAARALRGKIKLTGAEVWNVLRWYAHNRGYDGNLLWKSSSDDDSVELSQDEKDDIEKVEAAKGKMAEWGTSTMAETISLILGMNPDDDSAALKLDSPKYKNLNMAFPRNVVVDEVRRILASSDIPTEVQRLIIDDAKPQKEKLAECGVRFALRYVGSVLFGQLLPRFDNRIISRCPITWAHTYQAAIAEGKTKEQAKKEADKFAKVPKADSPEFYQYRFARILANIRVDDKPLASDIRNQLMKDGIKNQKFTKTAFVKRVEELTGSKNHNLKNYFLIVPESENSLILVPNEKNRATGRAPYARPVLKAVVAEVLRGEDPTKPALSLHQPTGEKKERDGVLYCLQNPESDVRKLQALRTIAQQTNNHLVRHRMLIFKRLIRDMVKHYAGGNPSLVKRCCIEVGRELREFSGKKIKVIEQELNARLKHFRSAKKKLEEFNASVDSKNKLSITGGLIRKCRIAMDLGWKCPYTGQSYCVKDLPHMELEHIVPYSSRQTNALSALVLTFPEVNKMKGKRTGIEFVREFSGQSIPGKQNLSIVTEKIYKEWVDDLDTKGAPDDYDRKKKRKSILLVEKTPQKGESTDLGFTEGQMTQSSQLMKFAAQVAGKRLKKAIISSIPGRITAETRKAWKIMHTLAESCPEIKIQDTAEASEKSETNITDDEGKESKILPKDEIRNITHMHHAVDACVLGLIPHLIPAGTNGVLWQAIAQRHLQPEVVKRLKEMRVYHNFLIDKSNKLHLQDIPNFVKSSIINALAEKRVATHIPADMGGAHFEENYKSIISVVDGYAVLKKDKSGKKELVSIDSMVGAHSFSKLQKQRAALKVKDNYCVVLDPEPVIVPHFHVYENLQRIKKERGLQSLNILKKDSLIKLSACKNEKKNGIWRVARIINNKNKGALLYLQRPWSAIRTDATNDKNWQNVLVKSIKKMGLKLLDSSYVGYSE